MKLNPLSLAVTIFFLLFGGIAFSSAMNWWHTESTKVPARYTDGAAAGQYDPTDIRGSYTFGEVSALFNVPLEDLQTAFRLPAGIDPETYPLKSLEEQFADLPVEIGTGSVRMFVAYYHGLPYAVSAEDDTSLFAEAAEILKAHNKMLPEQAAYLETHILQEMPADGDPPEAAPAITESVDVAATTAPTEHAAPDRSVTGKTTFQDLLDWGVTQETIEGILGESLPAANTVIKDYSSLKALEFSSMKTQLQAEVDKQK